MSLNMSPKNLLAQPYPAWIRLGIPLSGALFALLLAYGAQHFLKLHPCSLCLYERWPYWAVLFLGMLGFLTPPRVHTGLLWASMLILLGGIGLSFYHVGIEMHLFPLPAFCSNVQASIHDLHTLKAQVLTQPVVRCDMVAWRILGVSATLWNALYCIGLAFITALLAAHPERAQ